MRIDLRDKLEDLLEAIDIYKARIEYTYDERLNRGLGWIYCNSNHLHRLYNRADKIALKIINSNY